MSTVGSLVVEIAGDNSRLRNALNDSKRITNQFVADVQAAKADTAAQASALKEQLFRGALSPAEFKKQGLLSAQQYNAAVLDGISNLRASGQLTARLHASLVSELREIGEEAGQALGQGVQQGEEETATKVSPLARRFQTTGVAVAFALEGMAEGSESMVRRALRSVSALSFAFGPEVGGITLAITTATQFMLDFFHKADTEAENTMRQFRAHIAELVRGGTLPQAQREMQTLFSGDVAADVEGQRKGESDAQFQGRRLGIQGLQKLIAGLQTQLTGINAKTAGQPSPLAEVTTDAQDFGRTMRAVAQDAPANKIAEQIKGLNAELAFLQKQYGIVKPVFAGLVAGATQAGETRLELKAEHAHKKPTDPLDVLEKQLTQLVQTQSAIKSVGGDATVLESLFVDLWTTAERALDGHNDALDKTGLRLREIIAKSQDALGLTRKVAALPGVQFARPLAIHEQQPTVGAGISIFGQPLTTTAPAFQRAAGFVSSPQVANIASGPAALPSVAEARFRVAMDTVTEGLDSFGTSLKRSVVGGIGAAFRSIAGQLNPFGQIITGISEAARPLAPVLTLLADVVARDLAPIFKAFVPVIEALIPVIDAIMRVLSPIIVALAPMLEAFVPILRALFPIIREGAIIATYLFQAFATGASIFLRMVGNVVIGFGVILKALATAIDKLPFVSAKSAINAAQGIIDFGNSLLDASDDFKQSASQMADARDAIKKTTFDDTTNSVKALGEAAQESADAVNNANSWWKSSLAIWQAANPRGDGSGAAPFSGPIPGGPEAGTPGGGFRLPSTLTSGGGGGTGGGGGGFTPQPASLSINIDKINLPSAAMDPRAQLRAIISEAQRISQATFGTTARWAEVL